MAFAQIPLVIFVLLGQAYVEAAVVKHESPAQAFHNVSLATMFTNNTVVNAVKHEIEYELHLHSDVPEKNKMVWALLAFFLNILACDRCYMGQYCAGTLKFMTFGGCGIWAMIDIIAAIVNCYTMAEEIDMFMYKAKWEPNTVEGAYYVFIVWLIATIGPSVGSCLFYCCLMGLMGAQQAEKAYETLGSSKAMLPNTLAKNMRDYGLLKADPTEQEIQKLFNEYDTDKNGFLDKDELNTAFAAKGFDVNSFVEKVDKNKDGKISLEELREALLKPDSEA